MATVTMHSAEQEQPRRSAAPGPEQFEIQTDEGRRIVSKAGLKVREEMNLSECLGADTRMNPVWVLWATVACCVTEIDGEPVRMPTSKLQVEALVDRIGDEAMRTLLVKYRRHSEAREARILAHAKN